MTMNNKSKLPTETENDRKIKEYNAFLNTIGEMAGFYRGNPHRFAKDYLNITLKSFQQIILCEMFANNHVIYVAARGQGKSFLLAVFCVCMALLYPGVVIIIVSKTKEQAVEPISKIINELCKKNGYGSTFLRKEISYMSDSPNNAKVEFRNGSLVRIAPSTEHARHFRANVLIVDEYRMVPLSIITSVLKRFLTALRVPGFRAKGLYPDYKEPNKEIFASSAWEKDHWSYQYVKTYVKNMVRNKKYFVCDLPYQLSIKEKILEKGQIEDEMCESTFDEEAFSMEMEGKWRGNKKDSFYKYTDISKRRLLLDYYPSVNLVIDGKVKIPFVNNDERRILSVDVALMSSEKNDNDASALIINDVIPTHKNFYNANIKFIETHEGLTTDELGLMVMRYYYLYHCTDIVLDTNGVGLGIYDFIIKDQYDKMTGLTYPALSCCNDKVMAGRCKIRDAKEVVWSIKATDTFNSDAALILRNYIQTGRINFLVNKYEGEDYLKEKHKGFYKLSSEEQFNLKKPYIEVDLLVNEMINLNKERKGNKIRLSEKSGYRKDRYSSLAYNCYVMNEIELARKPKNNNKNKVIFASRKPKIYKR